MWDEVFELSYIAGGSETWYNYFGKPFDYNYN